MIYESYYGNVDIETGALSHHGIKGQKWGIRRFQNEDGSRTELGKKHRSGEWKEYVDKVKERVAQHKENKAKKKAAKLVENTQKAVLSGDIDRINKYKSNMSVSQLQEALNRARLTKQIQDMDHKDSLVKKGFDFVTKMTNYANTVSNAYDAAKRLSDKFKEPEVELGKDVNKKISSTAKDYAQYVRDNTDGSQAEKDAAYAAAYKRYMKEATAKAKEAIDEDEHSVTKSKDLIKLDAGFAYSRIKNSQNEDDDDDDDDDDEDKKKGKKK